MFDTRSPLSKSTLFVNTKAIEFSYTIAMHDVADTAKQVINQKVSCVNVDEFKPSSYFVFHLQAKDFSSFGQISDFFHVKM